jgi:hypothetical protein
VPKLPGATPLLRAARAPISGGCNAANASDKKKTIAKKMRAKAFYQRSPVAQAAPRQKVEEEESYVISDHEEDSDDSDANHRRATKKVPSWARRENLIPALEIQHSANYPIDPDDLFGEVETCDLDAIFPGRKLERCKRRGSSGNWEKDGITAEEKLEYKKKLKENH